MNTGDLRSLLIGKSQPVTCLASSLVMALTLSLSAPKASAQLLCAPKSGGWTSILKTPGVDTTGSKAYEISGSPVRTVVHLYAAYDYELQKSTVRGVADTAKGQVRFELDKRNQDGLRSSGFTDLLINPPYSKDGSLRMFTRFYNEDANRYEFVMTAVTPVFNDEGGITEVLRTYESIEPSTLMTAHPDSFNSARNFRIHWLDQKTFLVHSFIEIFGDIDEGADARKQAYLEVYRLEDGSWQNKLVQAYESSPQNSVEDRIFVLNTRRYIVQNVEPQGLLSHSTFQLVDIKEASDGTLSIQSRMLDWQNQQELAKVYAVGSDRVLLATRGTGLESTNTMLSIYDLDQDKWHPLPNARKLINDMVLLDFDQDSRMEVDAVDASGRFVRLMGSKTYGTYPLFSSRQVLATYAIQGTGLVRVQGSLTDEYAPPSLSLSRDTFALGSQVVRVNGNRVDVKSIVGNSMQQASCLNLPISLSGHQLQVTDSVIIRSTPLSNGEAGKALTFYAL